MPTPARRDDARARPIAVRMPPPAGPISAAGVAATAAATAATTAATAAAGDVPASAVARRASGRWLSGRAALDDALRVLFLTLLVFVFASAFQWQERLSAEVAGLERWQVDELPLSLLALALGLAWYAGRRRGESTRLLRHNRELTRRLIDLQDEERLFLARELHDELAQDCTAIRIEAACLRRASDPAQVAGAAQRAAEAAERLQQGVRRMLHRLRPPELDVVGLVGALQAMGAAWEARGGPRCEIAVDGPLDALDAKVATGVYRIAQEAGENTIRHAGASRIRLVLAVRGAVLHLKVEDDGRGFDPDAATAGLGLLGATERAALLGGRLEVASAPGAGCRLELSLPMVESAGSAGSVAPDAPVTQVAPVAPAAPALPAAADPRASEPGLR